MDEINIHGENHQSVNRPSKAKKKEMKRHEYALYYAIQGRRWETSRELLIRSDALRFLNYSPQILWFACIYSAPIDIIKCICELAPNQMFYQNSKNEKPLYGLPTIPAHTTPLMWICQTHDNQENDDVMELLIDFTSSSKEQAQVMMKPNSFGDLPLHEVVSAYARRSPQIIQKLILANRSAVRSTNDRGHTPFDIFCLTWEKNLERLGTEYEFYFHNVIPSMHQDIFHKADEWYEMLQTFLFLFEAFVYENSDSDSKGEKPTMSTIEDLDLPLHKALTIKSMSPIYLLLLMDMFPEEYEKKDGEGNFLIHIALSQDHFSSFYKCSDVNDNYCEEYSILTKELFHQIYDKNKKAIKQSNKYGETPLSLAIHYGYPFESIIFQKILRDSPESITQRNTYHDRTNTSYDTGLYPFMQACCCESEASINTVYELLKLDPSVLKCGIP